VFIAAGVVLVELSPLWAQTAGEKGLAPPADWPADVQVVPAEGADNSTADGAFNLGGFPCTISPRQTVELAAPVAGVIAEVSVRPGQMVAQGDVIARFDGDVLNRDLALSEKRSVSTKGLEIAQSRLAGLEMRLSRLQAATKSRAVPAADLENAQLEADIARGEVGREVEALALAQLDLERARVLVEKTIVRAPVAGRIGEDLIDPGESPTQAPIATIYVTTPMRIETYVPTNVVANFLELKGFSAQIAGKTYNVDFDHRGSVADLSSNTLSVFFNITSDEVLPGLDCKILNAPAGVAE
jgi:multidrug efflux pump subunit AcrA (membrane-fusion protein)